MISDQVPENNYDQRSNNSDGDNSFVVGDPEEENFQRGADSLRRGLNDLSSDQEGGRQAPPRGPIDHGSYEAGVRPQAGDLLNESDNDQVEYRTEPAFNNVNNNPQGRAGQDDDDDLDDEFSVRPPSGVESSISQLANPEDQEDERNRTHSRFNMPSNDMNEGRGASRGDDTLPLGNQPGENPSSEESSYLGVGVGPVEHRMEDPSEEAEQTLDNVGAHDDTLKKQNVSDSMSREQQRQPPSTPPNPTQPQEQSTQPRFDDVRGVRGDNRPPQAPRSRGNEQSEGGRYEQRAPSGFSGSSRLSAVDLPIDPNLADVHYLDQPQQVPDDDDQGSEFDDAPGDNSLEEDFGENQNLEDRKEDLLRSFVNNHPMSQSAISFEKTESFLSDKNSLIDQSKELSRGVTRRYDDSALGLHPFYVHDLSQIMNPNIDQILHDDKLLKDHTDTDQSKNLIRRLVKRLQFRIKNDNDPEVLKSFGFKMIQNFGRRGPLDFDHLTGVPQKRRRKRCTNKIFVLAGIYDKMYLMRAYTIWHEVLRAERKKEEYAKKFCHVLGMCIKNKMNDFKRFGASRIIEHTKDLQNQELNERLRLEEDEKRRQKNNENFLKLYEKLRQLEIKNKNFGFNSIRFDAEDAYGGTRRNRKYRKKAATMHFGHMLERIFEKQKKNALDNINQYNDFPGAARILRGDQILKNLLLPKIRTKHGKELFMRTKAWHHPRTRKNATTVQEAMRRILENRLNNGLRSIYSRNLQVLKHEKKLMFFSGAIKKLARDQKYRMVRDAFTEIYRLSRVKAMKMKNAKLLMIKLKKYLTNTKKDAFGRVKTIPEIAEKFYIANKRLERSMKLRAALKIGNYFSRCYDKFMNERIRKTVNYLRRFNNGYKKPVYYQRLTNFADLWNKKRRQTLEHAFYIINCRGTVHLLKRFFKNAINLGGGLNDEIVFAIQNNVKSKKPELNDIVEFWNTTYQVNEPSVSLQKKCRK